MLNNFDLGGGSDLLPNGSVDYVIGVGVAVGNSAHVHTSLDLEETIVTPSGSP